MRLTCDDMESAKPGLVKMPCAGGWYRGLTKSEPEHGLKHDLRQYSEMLFNSNTEDDFQYHLKIEEYCLGCRLIAIKLFLERYK